MIIISHAVFYSVNNINENECSIDKQLLDITSIQEFFSLKNFQKPNDFNQIEERLMINIKKNLKNYSIILLSGLLITRYVIQ
jgi:hypothetical protein